jgi:hypothetical protein
MVRHVARSSWPRFVLGLSFAVAAVTACDDDEPTSTPTRIGGAAGAAGEGGAHIGAGASRSTGGTRSEGGSGGIASSQIPIAGSTSVFDIVPSQAALPGMSIVVAHEVSRSPSFLLVGTVTETSADRMSSPNYSITLGASQ